MSGMQNDKPTVAHYASKYLPLTENWIYRTLINHRDFRPIFLTRKQENLQLFPFDPVFSLDSLSTLRQYLEIVFFLVTNYFRFFKKVCEQNNTRILHVHFGYHGVKSFGLAKKLSIPMVCSFYGDDAFAFKYQDKYRGLFQHADKILVLGSYMKAWLIKLGCPENKILIHHLGIDADKIQYVNRKKNNGEPVRMLIASSLLPKKGVDFAIRALGAVASKYPFSLDIIGDGPMKNELITLVRSSGLEDRVTWHGYRPYEYFISLARQCDVFVQASRTTEDNNKEGTPMAIVDAMAAGMVVVSTRHSDIPEIVLDGETGYLANENDLHSLIATFDLMFNNLDSFEQFGQQARAWIEQEFDARKQTIKLEQHYRSLIETTVKR